MAKTHRLGAVSLIPGLIMSAYGCVTTQASTPQARDGGPDATVPRDSGTDPRPDGGMAEDAAPAVADAAPDVANAARFGRIEGVIISMNQSGIDPLRIDAVMPDARVSIAGLQAVTTDASGHFAIDDVPVGDAVLVNVSKASGSPDLRGRRDAWSTTQMVVAVRDGQTTHVYPRLAKGCATTVVMGAPSDGGAGDAGDAGPPIERVLAVNDCQPYGDIGSIGFEQGGVARQNNQPFAGTMRVERVPIALPTVGRPLLSGLIAMPGDMRGIATGGAAVTLESLGAVEYRIYDEASGEALKIAPNRRVHLAIQVYRPPNANEVFPVWSYDATRGVWVEEGSASASPNDVEVVRFSASHLSWWNVDQPLANKTCLRGTVTGAGVPVPLGAVTAVGVDYGGRTTSALAANGAFCLEVKPNAIVDLLANSYAQSTFFLGGRSAVASGDAGASCAQAAACTDVGNIALLPQNPQCVRARFLTRAEADGGVAQIPFPVRVPVSIFAEVNAATESRDSLALVGRVTPNANGEACLPLPSAGIGYSLVLEGLHCPNSTSRPSVFTAAADWTAPDGGGLDAGDAGVFGSCGAGGCYQANGDLEFNCFAYE